MVLSAITIAALAPLTGALFGASYGTAIRIGYEIIFPSLFPNGKPVTKDSKEVLKSMEGFYTRIGGLEAHKFGIKQGVKLAMDASQDPNAIKLVDMALGNVPAMIQGGSGPGGAGQDFDPTGKAGRLRALYKHQYEEDLQSGKFRRILDGDYVDADGDVRNDILDDVTQRRMLTFWRQRLKPPINWPSNWGGTNGLIAQYWDRLREAARGNLNRTGSATPVREHDPEQIGTNSTIINSTKQVIKNSIKNVERQIQEKKRQLSKAKLDVGKAKSELRALQSLNREDNRIPAVEIRLNSAESSLQDAISELASLERLLNKTKALL